MHIQRHFESLAEGNRGIWIYSAIPSCLTLKRVLNETGEKKKKKQDLISDQTIEKSTHRLLLHGITPWDLQLLLLIVFFFL